jgi:aerobic-type carbon monoxide dehydrogenase small subunit (CoxS/CutS family)
MSKKLSLFLNDESVHLEVSPESPLVRVLRDNFYLTGALLQNSNGAKDSTLVLRSSSNPYGIWHP